MFKISSKLESYPKMSKDSSGDILFICFYCHCIYKQYTPLMRVNVLGKVDSKAMRWFFTSHIFHIPFTTQSGLAVRWVVQKWKNERKKKKEIHPLYKVFLLQLHFNSYSSLSGSFPVSDQSSYLLGSKELQVWSWSFLKDNIVSSAYVHILI